MCCWPCLRYWHCCLSSMVMYFVGKICEDCKPESTFLSKNASLLWPNHLGRPRFSIEAWWCASTGDRNGLDTRRRVHPSCHTPIPHNARSRLVRYASDDITYFPMSLIMLEYIPFCSLWSTCLLGEHRGICKILLLICWCGCLWYCRSADWNGRNC